MFGFMLSSNRYDAYSLALNSVRVNAIDILESRKLSYSSPVEGIQ